MFHDYTPNFPDLTSIVKAQAPLASSPAHGEGHWRAVARTGLLLASHDSRIDPGLVLLFGLLHDSQRCKEDEDPGHGPRAEDYLEKLRADRLITISDERANILGEAMRLHDGGLTSEQPTIGACWDADRLQLQRFKYWIKNEYLSTHAATTLETQTQVAPWHKTDQLSWDALAEIAHDFTRKAHLS